MTEFTVFATAVALRHLGPTAAAFDIAGRQLTALHAALLLRLPVGRAAVVAAERIGPLMQLRCALRILCGAVLSLPLAGSVWRAAVRCVSCWVWVARFAVCGRALSYPR